MDGITDDELREDECNTELQNADEDYIEEEEDDETVDNSIEENGINSSEQSLDHKDEPLTLLEQSSPSGENNSSHTFTSNFPVSGDITSNITQHASSALKLKGTSNLSHGPLPALTAPLSQGSRRGRKRGRGRGSSYYGRGRRHVASKYVLRVRKRGFRGGRWGHSSLAARGASNSLNTHSNSSSTLQTPNDVELSQSEQASLLDQSTSSSLLSNAFNPMSSQGELPNSSNTHVTSEMLSSGQMGSSKSNLGSYQIYNISSNGGNPTLSNSINSQNISGSLGYQPTKGNEGINGYSAINTTNKRPKQLKNGDIVKFSSLYLIPGKPTKWRQTWKQVGHLKLKMWEAIPDTSDDLFTSMHTILASGGAITSGIRKSSRNTRATPATL